MTAWIFYELYPDHTWTRVVIALDSPSEAVARSLYAAHATARADALVLPLLTGMPPDGNAHDYFPTDRVIVIVQGEVPGA